MRRGHVSHQNPKADNDKLEDGIALKKKAEASSCPGDPTSAAIGCFLDFLDTWDPSIRGSFDWVVGATAQGQKKKARGGESSLKEKKNY